MAETDRILLGMKRTAFKSAREFVFKITLIFDFRSPQIRVKFNFAENLNCEFFTHIAM